jgi:hypothetical protein
MQRVNQTARCVLLWASAFCIASSAAAAPKTYLQTLGPNGVDIHVELDAPAAVELTVKGPGAPAPINSPAAAVHAMSVRGLEPHTRYTYSVGGIDGAFVTAAPDSSTEPFTALLYGDNRTDDEAHALVVREMLRTPSDLLLHTGDFVSDSRQKSEWSRFFSIEQPLLRDRCVFAAIGNHDLIDDGDAYKRYFGTANRSVRWEFARFWMVNAMDDSPRTWLLRDLAEHDNEPGLLWRVVVLHQGPWSSGPHGANDVIDDAIVDKWRAHKVDMVLSGHDHIYERGYAHGIGYIVSGGGGAPPYRIETKLGTTRTAEASRHFVELRFLTDDIRITAHRADGTTIEERIFHKGEGWDEDIAGPKNPGGEAAKPEAKPAEKAETKLTARNIIWAAAGGTVLVLLILALRRRYRNKEKPDEARRNPRNPRSRRMRDLS